MLRNIATGVLRILLSKLRGQFRYLLYPRFAVDRNYYSEKGRYQNYPKDAKFANLGAGSHFFHKYWTCYDFYKNFSDKLMPNRKSIDFTKVKKLDEKYDLVYSSHVLEHIPRKHLDSVCKLIFDCLKDTGAVRIQVPDGKAIYNAYKNANYTFFEIYSSKLPKDFDHEWRLEYLLLFLIATAKTENAFDLEYYQKIRANSKHMAMNEFFDWLLEGVVENSEDGQNHVNWFDYEKLKFHLEKAGFEKIYISGFGQSMHTPMKQIPLFDSWLPCISLYVEAQK